VLLPLLALGACGDEKPGDEGGPGERVTTPYGADGSDLCPGADTLDARVDAALAQGRDLLLSWQNADGSWGDPGIGMATSVGYSAMAAQALIGATPKEARGSDPAVKKALAFLAANQKPDGSIHDEASQGHKNYTTSAAVGAFAAARVAEFVPVVAKAKDYLVASQFQENPEDLNFGAFPYSSRSPRPADLSNVQFAAQALADAGLPADHPAWSRILTYLAKVQNRSETNRIRVERDADGDEATTEVVVSGNDGGSAYAPGLSYAGWDRNADGTWRPRSYGSMTYALLKCLLLAGVDAKDPRVVAALGWIAKNFAVDRNPGFEGTKDPATEGQQAYYYFVYTASRTLAEFERIAKEPLPVTDATGKSHDWRRDFAEALLARRGKDGSWRNEIAERWEEGSAVLATSYALVSLAVARGRL
jgi:squalene-hopene/tetraprenyl-beta-curcumene cyclase